MADTIINKIVRSLEFKDALAALVKKLAGTFVKQESGKGLSANDYTTAEKNKLAGVADGANAYTLPTASTTVLGGVKIGARLTVDPDTGTVSADVQKTDLSDYQKTADADEKYATKSTVQSVSGDVSALQSSVQDVKDDISTNYAKKSDISAVFHYKGSVDAYADLPTNGMAVGDMYNVVAADPAHEIYAGENVAWNGNAWDPMGGVIDLSPYQKTTDADAKYLTVADNPFATSDELVAIVNEVFTA